jgi:hypothetical protein
MKKISVPVCFKLMILYIFLFTGSLTAQNKPTVSVEVKIEEDSYKNVYPIQEIHKRGPDILIKSLESYFNFIDFTSTVSNNHLIISLGKELPQSSKKSPWVVMKMVLRRDGAEPIEYAGHWDFNRLTPLPDSLEGFLEKLAQGFLTWIDKEQHRIVLSLLSKVKVGSKAHPIPKYKYWVMPFKREDLQIAFNAQLNIDVFIPDAFGGENITYQTMMLRDPTPDRTPDTPTLPNEFRGMSKTKLLNSDTTRTARMYDQNLVVEGIYLVRLRIEALGQSSPSKRPIRH